MLFSSVLVCATLAQAELMVDQRYVHQQLENQVVAELNTKETICYMLNGHLGSVKVAKDYYVGNYLHVRIWELTSMFGQKAYWSYVRRIY